MDLFNQLPNLVNLNHVEAAHCFGVHLAGSQIPTSKHCNHAKDDNAENTSVL